MLNLIKVDNEKRQAAFALLEAYHDVNTGVGEASSDMAEASSIKNGKHYVNGMKTLKVTMLMI